MASLIRKVLNRINPFTHVWVKQEAEKGVILALRSKHVNIDHYINILVHHEAALLANGRLEVTRDSVPIAIKQPVSMRFMLPRQRVIGDNEIRITQALEIHSNHQRITITLTAEFTHYQMQRRDVNLWHIEEMRGPNDMISKQLLVDTNLRYVAFSKI